MLSSITAHQKGRCRFVLWDVRKQKERWRRRREKEATISRFRAWKSSTSQYYKKDQSVWKCVILHRTSWVDDVWGGRFLSCTGDIPKSAEVGGKHGAVQCKAAAGFLPVHRCRSPHIHLIQSHRHQMPRECQTQSLERQEAQRKKHKQKHNKRGYAREKSTSVSKCKCCCQDWKDG